jgi:hypothetical protein
MRGCVLAITAELLVPGTMVHPLDVALAVNVADTVRACDIVTTQLPVPVQGPLHPVKLEPLDAPAVKVTVVPLE